ncbi:MAG: murein biosynthesis integral membrane protein MurJ [Clostridia bacterium]|nr:murein biosynthesis integral membrane protein MurJ [Clostridia bacterium]
MESSKRRALIGSTMSVTLIIFISKAIGFIREMIMANYFGADSITDAYNSAYSLFYLPVLLFSSCITSTLVPLYLRSERELGNEGARRFSANTITLFSLAALAVSLVMFVLSRPLVKLVYPGFSGEKLELAVTLTRIMMPALIFFVAGLVLSSLLNAKEKYVAAQLTGLPLSFAEIAAAIFLSKRYGIYPQAWGVLAAGILQIVVLVPFFKGSLRYKPTFDPKDVFFRRMLVLAVPALLSMAVNELNHMVDRMLASGLNDGDISAMSYAFKPIMFIMGVLVVPLTTVSFSKMARQSIANDPSLAIPQVRESIKLLLTAALPIVLIAAVESRHIIRFAYGRGAFSEDSVIVTGKVFLCYVVGVPFFGLRDLTNRVYHAFEDTATPMYIAAISVAVNIALNLLLRPLMGVYGLALATGIAAFVGVILLFVKLKKKVSGLFGKDFVLELMRIAAMSLPVLAAALLLSRILPEAYGTGRVFLRLALISLISLGVYAALLLLADKKRLQSVISRLLKKR